MTNKEGFLAIFRREKMKDEGALKFLSSTKNILKTKKILDSIIFFTIISVDTENTEI
ncbi:MAG: hypothetical protein PHE88_02040 [Elusimicrobia bacterium]|nr:hypothetical protein [Elusimicrobiota bacterium]